MPAFESFVAPTRKTQQNQIIWPAQGTLMDDPLQAERRRRDIAQRLNELVENNGAGTTRRVSPYGQRCSTRASLGLSP